MRRILSGIIKEVTGISKDDAVKNALMRCATGLSASETVEEFAVQDGQLTLVKRKVTRREIPPDIKAVKLLLDGKEELSDEELEEEKERLLALLDEGEQRKKE